MKEDINAIFEGVISLLTIGGAFYLVNTHPGDSAVVGVAAGMASAVITFWFGQRQTTKAVNGNIQAMADIAGQINQAVRAK